MTEKREEAKIKIEIEKLYGDMDDAIMALIKGRALRDDTMIANAQYKMESLMVQTQQVLIYVLESLGIEPFKPIKSRTYEDLEEAAKEYSIRQGIELKPYANKFFKAGANWQKEKDTRDMLMSDNRNFKKVYDIGKKDMKEEMVGKACEWLYNALYTRANGAEHYVASKEKITQTEFVAKFRKAMEE